MSRDRSATVPSAAVVVDRQFRACSILVGPRWLLLGQPAVDPAGPYYCNPPLPPSPRPHDRCDLSGTLRSSPVSPVLVLLPHFRAVPVQTTVTDVGSWISV